MLAAAADPLNARLEDPVGHEGGPAKAAGPNHQEPRAGDQVDDQGQQRDLGELSDAFPKISTETALARKAPANYQFAPRCTPLHAPAAGTPKDGADGVGACKGGRLARTGLH